jgi:hypothetical protein
MVNVSEKVTASIVMVTSIKLGECGLQTAGVKSRKVLLLKSLQISVCNEVRLVGNSMQRN